MSYLDELKPERDRPRTKENGKGLQEVVEESREDSGGRDEEAREG
jgi:hypothetical protein